jgi:CDP-glucose 4,6-dehydratase
LCKIDQLLDSCISDIRNLSNLTRAVRAADPQIIFHLAAQPLVRESYQYPIETYQTNVMGTANLLEAARTAKNARAIVVVTTDKCYENAGRGRDFCETDPLGGFDPYSSSKAGAELVTSAYRNSFFGGGRVVSARAGNVVGGGDFALDRLVPDCIRAYLSGKKLLIRNPSATRPWQHVLEPLSGYLLLAEKLYADDRRYAGAWNFGPSKRLVKPVIWVARKLCAYLEMEDKLEIDRRSHPHEASLLSLNSAKAHRLLGWRGQWSLEQTLASIAAWTKHYVRRENLRQVCLRQIEEYMR